MYIAVVTWTRGNHKSYGVYNHPDTLIDRIYNNAYSMGLQKKLFGNWSCDYNKIVNRANRIFSESKDYYAPRLSFVGEYDTENVNDVYKIECHEKDDKMLCTFYLNSNKKSGAITVDLNGGEVDFYNAVDAETGKKKIVSEQERETIYDIIDKAELLEQKPETTMYLLRRIERPTYFSVSTTNY